MSVTCPACHGENRDGARWCTNCGAELTTACPQCHARNKHAARFCVQCGHALMPTTAPTVPAASTVPSGTATAPAPAAAPIPAFTPEAGADADPVTQPTFDALTESVADPVVAAALDPALLLHPEPLAAGAPPAPLDFEFDGGDHPAAVPARQRPVAAYALAAVAALALAGTAAWYLLGRPDAAATTPEAPAVAAPSAMPDTPSTAESAPARAEPVEEIIESERARPVAAASAPASAAPPAPVSVPAPSAAERAFTPVTVPRVADAASRPSSAKRPATPADDAPWPPEARPAPSSGDSLTRLRGALAQCAAMSNELSRATCLGRTRQNFCGDAWGRIPECPLGQ